MRTRIYRLPSVLLAWNRMTSAAYLHHTVNEALVLATLILVRALSMTSFLRHESHGKLSDVDRVVRVVMTADVSRLSSAAVRGRGRAVLIDKIEVDVVHHGCRLTLHVSAVVAGRLDRAEATCVLWSVHVRHSRVVVRDGLLSISLLMARLDDRVVRLVVVMLRFHRATDRLVRGHVVAEVRVVPVAACSCAD